jgi:alpha/beta hydrolase fold
VGGAVAREHARGDAILGASVTHRDADVSPLYADLTGLPPVLFSCGTLDPLLDDTLFMAARWRTAGGEAQLAIYPGAPHEFLNLRDPISAEHQARQRMIGFIEHVLADDGPKLPTACATSATTPPPRRSSPHSGAAAPKTSSPPPPTRSSRWPRAKRPTRWRSSLAATTRISAASQRSGPTATDPPSASDAVARAECEKQAWQGRGPGTVLCTALAR